MSAISGIRRQAKELVDGTIRLTVDFEPSQRKLFWELLPEIDMPVGIAPLKPDYQRETTSNTVVKQSSTTSDYVADVNNKVNKKPYGDLAKTLYLSYFGALSFLRTPKVLESVGTDGEFQAWCRAQVCAKSGRKGTLDDPLVFAHVRRVFAGAGTGIKPKYWGIPLLQSIHAEQHQKGEESILGKEWAENARDRHVSRWIAKAIFAQESMGCVSPYAIVDWAKEKGLSNLLPKDYSIFRKFNNCKKCGEQMRAGKYINQTYSGLPDFAGGEVVTMSPGGTGSLENCLKCVNCGWSTA